MNTCKKILGFKSTGQTDHVPCICLPQRDPPTVHSRYTHRSSALPEGPLGGLPSLSLTTKGSWIHLWGRVAKPLVSSLTSVPPTYSDNNGIMLLMQLANAKTNLTHC